MPIRRVSPAAAKLALHEAMVRGGVPNVELARRLGADEKMVRRLRDPLHGSRIEAVEAALRVLGKRLEISARAVTEFQTERPNGLSGPPRPLADHTAARA
jgi:antitoxin HicB